MDNKTSSEELTLDEKDFALSLQLGLLACRDGPRFDIEPYYPHRFAHQFGFDQDVPVHLPRIPRYQREVGVGPLHWLVVCSRFEGVKFSCELRFPSSDRTARETQDYVHWYGICAMKVVQQVAPESRFWAFKPLDLSTS